MPHIDDWMVPLPAGSVELRGRLGAALERSIANRLKKVNYPHLVDPFRLRNECDGKWRCEFWGKIVRSAIFSWRGSRDEELLQMIRETVADLLSTQTPDGCISSYPAELQTGDWDIWGRKYALYGLIWYDREVEPSEPVRSAIVRALDYLASQVGPAGKRIVDCGHHNGMAASSILGAVVMGYRITGEERFLSYAKWIASQGGSDSGSLFAGILQGVPPADLANGKAYEMMSCFEGLAELYRETGEREYLNAVTAFYRAVRDREILITGVGGLKDRWGEFWDGGKLKQTQSEVGALGETCVTVTWLKFCGQVLRLNGDSTVADEMERTLCNGILGAMVPDGSWWMHRNPTPLAGAAEKIRAGDQIPGYGEDCCLAQGPMGLAVAPWLAVMRDAHGPVVNLYERAEAVVPLDGGNSVRLVLDGDFPRTADAGIAVIPAESARFRLRMRIPGWSRRTEVRLNGKACDARAGGYLSIERFWEPGDRIEIHFDMPVRAIPAFDGGGRVALMRGPVVLAQDSRLGPVDSPVSVRNCGEAVPQPSPIPGIDEVFRLADGTVLCDYAFAGNEFRAENQLCVWMRKRE